MPSSPGFNVLRPPEHRGDSEVPSRSPSGFDRRPPLESGVPPARRPHASPSAASGHGEAEVQAALAASSRTEASLGALLRAVQYANAGIHGAREANRELTHELELLRQLLGASSRREAELSQEVQELEARVARAEHDALSDRRFLMNEQDAFIVSLCDDYEREVAALREQLTRADAQRDEAQALLVRIASERDQALTELARSNVPRSSRPSAPAAPAGPPSRPGVSMRLSSAAPSQRRPEPVAPPPRLEHERAVNEPPLELALELTPPPAPARMTTSSALRARSDPATRPLIGYSLRLGEVEAEHIEAAAISTRPTLR